MLCYLSLSCGWPAVQDHKVSLHKYIKILEVLSVVLVTLCWWLLKCYFWSVWFQLDIQLDIFCVGAVFFAAPSLMHSLRLYIMSQAQNGSLSIFSSLFSYDGRRWRCVTRYYFAMKWKNLGHYCSWTARKQDQLPYLLINSTFEAASLYRELIKGLNTLDV